MRTSILRSKLKKTKWLQKHKDIEVAERNRGEYTNGKQNRTSSELSSSEAFTVCVSVS